MESLYCLQGVPVHVYMKSLYCLQEFPPHVPVHIHMKCTEVPIYYDFMKFLEDVSMKSLPIMPLYMSTWSPSPVWIIYLCVHTTALIMSLVSIVIRLDVTVTMGVNSIHQVSSSFTMWVGGQVSTTCWLTVTPARPEGWVPHLAVLTPTPTISCPHIPIGVAAILDEGQELAISDEVLTCLKFRHSGMISME